MNETHTIWRTLIPQHPGINSIDDVVSYYADRQQGLDFQSEMFRPEVIQYWNTLERIIEMRIHLVKNEERDTAWR